MRSQPYNVLDWRVVFNFGTANQVLFIRLDLEYLSN
jgi:hypothetical protein